MKSCPIWPKLAGGVTQYVHNTCWEDERVCRTIYARHMVRRWVGVSHTICMTHGEKMSGCVAHCMHDTWWEAEHVCRTLYAGHMVWRWAGVSHTICTILLQIRGGEGWESRENELVSADINADRHSQYPSSNRLELPKMNQSVDFFRTIYSSWSLKITMYISTNYIVINVT